MGSHLTVLLTSVLDVVISDPLTKLVSSSEHFDAGSNPGAPRSEQSCVADIQLSSMQGATASCGTGTVPKPFLRFAGL
jgi:hypothetical protein